MHSILALNVQNCVGFLGLRPRHRWGSLRRSPKPPSRYGLLAFGSRSFAPSALTISLTPMFICEKLLNFRLPRLHPLGTYSTSIFFHVQYVPLLKFLKICPARTGRPC